MTYENVIELLDEMLKLYSTYIASNALVSRANKIFNVTYERYRFVWSINRKILIQDVDNDDQLDLQPSSDMDTKSFGQLYDYKSKRQAINIIGVMISKLPREFIVTNRT
nr:replication protein A 70 kDa DNA-binding subunit B-like isoform X1 [Ipomoea batatas]